MKGIVTGPAALRDSGESKCQTMRHGRDHATFAREIWDWWKEEGWL